MKPSLIERLSADLLLPRDKIAKIAKSAPHSYKVYTIPKRTGGNRTIYHPSKPLKALQRWIVRHITGDLPVHSAATAYRLGQSILQNAKAHQGSHYLLRMDFTGFFESITSTDIHCFLRSPSTTAKISLGPDDIDLFVQLVTHKGGLTVGAPTSPSLSNAICYELDFKLADYCSAQAITYTRYADDLFFSTQTPDILSALPDYVEQTITALPFPKALKINKGKTRHSSKKGRRRVTGLTLTPEGSVSVGRNRKRIVRALIHQYAKLDARSKDQLRGHISYILSIDPDFLNALILKYGAQLMHDIIRGTNQPAT